MTKTKTAVVDPLMAAIQPRITRGLAATDVRTLRRQFHEIHERYRGGLVAEVQSRDALLKANGLQSYRRRDYRPRGARHKRLAIRRVILGRYGRPIDLVSLLKQRRADGLPLWSVANPLQSITTSNGAWQWPSSTAVAFAYVAGNAIAAGKGGNGESSLVAPGLPVLPKRVREILTGKEHEKLRERAKWIGVLYQPEEWQQVNPDPALVVEYTDIPGEYYALAVWGGDRAQIMEWVD